MMTWLRRLVGGGGGGKEVDDLLSPNCQLLVGSYDFEAGWLIALEIDPVESKVVLEMELPVLESHPAYSALSDVRRVVTATFQGALEATATLHAEPVPRGEPMDFEPELAIDEFYISATCPWSYRESSYHTHALWLLAEGLVLAFPFTDVRCREVLDD